MMNMPRMHDVETAVAMNDGFPTGSRSIAQGKQPLPRHNLSCGRPPYRIGANEPEALIIGRLAERLKQLNWRSGAGGAQAARGVGDLNDQVLADGGMAIEADSRQNGIELNIERS